MLIAPPAVSTRRRSASRAPFAPRVDRKGARVYLITHLPVLLPVTITHRQDTPAVRSWHAVGPDGRRYVAEASGYVADPRSLPERVALAGPAWPEHAEALADWPRRDPAREARERRERVAAA